MGLIDAIRTEAINWTHWRDEKIEKGLKEGLEKGKKEMAKRLHQMGLSLEKISEAINLSLEEVKQILHK